MRIQFSGQSLRLRVDQAEVTRLLAGEMLRDETRWPDGRAERREVRLGGRDGWERTHDGWCITVAATPVRELAAHLPAREGCMFELPAAAGQSLQVRFDVDVRDGRRHAHGAPGTGD